MRQRATTGLSTGQKLAMTPGLATSIRVLHHDAGGLTRYLEEQAAQNPAIVLQQVVPAAGEWSPRWTTAFAGVAGDFHDTLAAADPGLIAHVAGQLGHLLPDAAARRIGVVFLQALEPSGWLGRPLADLAAEAGVGLPAALGVLKALQQAEPTGVFARDLGECLRLQAAEQGELDTVMDCTLQHLDLLARGDLDRLARMCKVARTDIERCLRRIRAYDPKPGARFGQGAAPVREPDLLVHRRGKGWVVETNRHALPQIMVDADGARDAAALAQARALRSMVASRDKTLLRIGGEVAQRQIAMLDKGPEHLAPMTMAGVAGVLGMHESTVSRAVAGVSMDTPRGTLWLRALFSGGPDASAPGMAAAAVRARLSRLVGAEDPAAPLSDAALAEALAGEGAEISRRTVAKYRGLAGIAPAHRRRQR